MKNFYGQSVLPKLVWKGKSFADWRLDLIAFRAEWQALHSTKQQEQAETYMTRLQNILDGLKETDPLHRTQQ